MDNNSEVVYLYLDDIIPNRFQPREVFDDQALKELAVSIKEHGVIQPIIVRKVENKYEIIAGERRYKASTMAGLTKIPAIVKNLDDKESSKVALIENLQRKDLSPIEEARTYQKILELEDNMTQEELAATMGKTQSSVSNKLRLLELPEEIQDALLKEKISERHARSLLSLEDKNDQIKLMDKVISEKMTVRDLEKEIKVMKGELSETKDVSAPAFTETMNNTLEQPTVVPTNDFATPVSTQEESKPLDNIEIPKPDLDSFVSPSAPAETPSFDGGINLSTTQTSDTATGEEKENVFLPPMDSIGDSDKNIDSPDLFANLFNSNVNTSSTSSTIASSISTDEISAPVSKNVDKAITDIKSTINSLKDSGYKVSFEETDDLNNYKINIQIDKN